MPKELLERLNGILDWWKIGDFTDRKGIEKELTSLLDDAYFQGWSDAKDDSFFFEDCMRDDGNLAED